MLNKLFISIIKYSSLCLILIKITKLDYIFHSHRNLQILLDTY